jgi:hypothetical protein
MSRGTAHNETLRMIFSQNDVDLAMRRIDNARQAILAYTERTDGSPFDQHKHNALLGQLNSAIREHEELVSQMLKK